MTVAPLPGWYSDPAGAPGLFRWWDGVQWTDALNVSPHSPPPQADPDLDGEPEPWVPEVTTTPSTPRRHRSRRRTATAVLLGFALVLSATAGVGLFVARDPVNLNAARQAATGSAIPANGQLNTETRVATIDQVSMTLPDDPFALRGDPMEVPGVLAPLFVATAPVHERYNGSQDWSAMVLLARVDPVLDHDELADEGGALVDRLAATLFVAHKTTISQLTASAHPLQGLDGALVTARVTYDVDHLPSRYDTMTVLLLRLPSGSVVAAVSSVPDDTDQGTAAMVTASLESLRVG